MCRFGYLGSSGSAQVSTYGAGCYHATPLSLAASARPIQGTTIDLVAGNVPATAVGRVAVLGAQKLNPGIDLTVINMPGCYQHCSLDIALPVSASRVPLGIPLGAQLTGLHVFSQGVTFVPAVNPFGALSSNGLDLLLGAQ